VADKIMELDKILEILQSTVSAMSYAQSETRYEISTHGLRGVWSSQEFATTPETFRKSSRKVPIQHGWSFKT